MAQFAIADELRKLAEAASGGGGNPNSVQTVEGTLENPFGIINPILLAQEINAGNATATLEFATESRSWTLSANVTDLGDDYMNIDFRYADFSSAIQVVTGRFSAAFVSYEYAVGEEPEIFEGPFVVISAMSSSQEYDVDVETQSTLTIIWHPLPG